jgi:NADPH2:quinone reductase
MRAARITRRGGPEVLELVEVPELKPGPGELRVAVHASGLNRADLLQCMGLYPAPPGWPSDIPGLEYAGTVDALGAGVTRFRVGDRVMGVVGGGGLASQVLTRELEAVPVPLSLSLSEAAAVPEAFFTAHDALVTQGGLARGETVLIHAAGSGVGTAGLQLVTAWGATGIGTARTEEKLERCQTLGLQHGLLCKEPVFAERVRELTAGRGVALTLDLVGGGYLPETLRATASRGRIIVVGLMSGASAELELGRLLQQRIRIQGTVLRSRAPEERQAVAEAFTREVVPLLEGGKVKPVLEKEHPASELQAALQAMAGNQTFGKHTVRWG